LYKAYLIQNEKQPSLAFSVSLLCMPAEELTAKITVPPFQSNLSFDQSETETADKEFHHDDGKR
jgi:hypothetical protein